MSLGHKASPNCFSCGDPVVGRHVYARIRHTYRNGNTEDRDWRLHEQCFEKLTKPYGQLVAPVSHQILARFSAGLRRLGVSIPSTERDLAYATEYEVLDSETRDPGDADWTGEGMIR